jgi:protocatechuate 3,4-dioxygenase beta subunit
VRSLGQIGDKHSIPVLINLLDHNNWNVRTYAKVSLAQIAGVYLGDDKEKWREWCQEEGLASGRSPERKKEAGSDQRLLRPQADSGQAAYSISGRVLDENGKPLANTFGMQVWAWAFQDEGRWSGHYRRISSSRVDDWDASYSLKRLDGRPVYVMAIDWDASNKDEPYPPRFYPGTFSRGDATLITFNENRAVENVDIPLAKEGGLVLEGVVTDETSGAPVPHALVAIHHMDMLFDIVPAYTDTQGRYRVECLGEGQFLVHVDAVHKGYVKTRKPTAFGPGGRKTRLDFALTRGVSISGGFVDEEGNNWQVPRKCLGTAYTSVPGPPQRGGSSHFAYNNKYAPSNIRGNSLFYQQGEGDNRGTIMLYPTKCTFLLPAVLPGSTTIRFNIYTRDKDQRVSKILYQGKDILRSGFDTQAGREIKDVSIVVGAASGGRQEVAQIGEQLEFSLPDAFGHEVRSQDYKGVPVFLEFGACW